MKYKIYIENGKEKPYNQILWENRYNRFHGKDVEIEIRLYRKSRTLEQNKKYWMYLKILSEFTGYTKEELHIMLATDFLGVNETKFKDKIYKTPISTTTLNVEQFMNYLEQIRLWAAQEFGIILENEQL